ncbi:Cnl2/NKP2 family protein-domain-containing protein [Stachybotrys elegans]|uniref:Cnl2/NKP2 family protein-domain-containing protein n=1 Tax=Stachybotrys elegans TaxID=80388 RepID=A0A8K0WSQ4_9HYPO|nr:Cnl2/NKP2 family protein-domain-containing protein [Stachybotrys elegans]
MAPTESDILSNHLLQPAALTSITTLQQFETLFPSPLHGSSQLRALFRDLQAQRNNTLDIVAANIAAEVKRGVAMRREVVRARREAEQEELDGEIEIQRALFGDASGVKAAKHTLQSVIPDLEDAAAALELEIAKLEEEEAALKESVKQTVGGLSDLRYGKLSNSQLKDEISGGLMSLQEACANKS